MYALVTGKAMSSLMLLLILIRTAEQKEILSYQSGDTTRMEKGTPGSSVTGEWSWMDYNGQKRTIRYIADDKGFRAFGDVIPGNEWSQADDSKMPIIGSSVVTSLPSTSDNIDKAPSLQDTELKDEEDKQQVLEENEHKQNISASLSDISILEDPQMFMDTIKNLVQNSHVQESENVKPEKSENKPLIFENVKYQQPRRISGTSFILLSHMRLPARDPATDVPRASPIKPRPVEISGTIHSPVTGILTAPRAINVLNHKIGKDLISVLKPVERIVPKPSKVEGMLNLDNYLRPAHASSRTPSPNENDYDYYYYDDYYYDDSPDGQLKGKKNSTASKQRTIRSEESRESFEDFEYDLSKEKRRRV